MILSTEALTWLQDLLLLLAPQAQEGNNHPITTPGDSRSLMVLPHLSKQPLHPQTFL